jgi:uncharacterized membrane protein YoaK (UPF0700 family)
MTEARLIRLLVVLLCITSGSIDAIAVTSLGGAFVTVITGNVVLVGVAIGSQSAGHAVACFTAILAYIAGTALGTRLLVPARGATEQPWHRRVLLGIGVELVLFAGIAIGWVVTHGSPPRSAETAILVIAATAMGLQGVAARQFPVVISTTYLTGALTGLVEALAARRALSATESAAAWGLASLATGAAIAIAILAACPQAAIFVPVVALGLTAYVVNDLRTVVHSEGAASGRSPHRS